MLIEIFADFSCPWCFVGRRRLARARALRPQLPAQTLWQPFQLNPELPAQGVDRDLYLRTKFGDPGRIRAMDAALEESGGKDGIRFAFATIRRIPNTMAAHRLMRFAARSQKEDDLAERIFSAYFEHGGDIGDPAALISIASSIGLDADSARAFLEGDAERDAVAATDELARQGGITGVPYFIFNRRYALAGAQEPVAFLPLFDALASEELEPLSSPI